MFFSGLSEWCHPHSVSAYVKSWQCSASTVTMATAMHLPHFPQQNNPAVIGQCVPLAGTLSNKRACEWCHWNDRTVAGMHIQPQSVRNLLLTHQLNLTGRQFNIISLKQTVDSRGWEVFQLILSYTNLLFKLIWPIQSQLFKMLGILRVGFGILLENGLNILRNWAGFSKALNKIWQLISKKTVF